MGDYFVIDEFAKSIYEERVREAEQRRNADMFAPERAAGRHFVARLIDSLNIHRPSWFRGWRLNRPCENC
jgi:hypothetical protein